MSGDIGLTPGVADFGVVPRSLGNKPTIQLSLNYSGGQPNWGITRMQTAQVLEVAKIAFDWQRMLQSEFS